MTLAEVHVISNFDGYLGLRHFLYFLNERTGFTSWWKRISSRLVITLKWTSDQKVACFLSRLNEISGGCEKIFPVSESFKVILSWLFAEVIRFSVDRCQVGSLSPSDNSLFCLRTDLTRSKPRWFLLQFRIKCESAHHKKVDTWFFKSVTKQKAPISLRPSKASFHDKSLPS